MGYKRPPPAGERPVKRDNITEQQQSSKDERIVLANPSPDAAIIGPSTDNQTEATNAGYGSSSGAWDGYSQYANADGLNVLSPVIYNDGPSVVFHSGYGFNPDGAYGQYSPVATPMPSLMLEGQLYPAQRLPFSPSYYPQQATPGLPHASSPFPVSPTELITPESGSFDNMLYSPGSGYLVNFGSFGGGNLPGNLGSGTMPSTSTYPPPMGILGSYDHNARQVSQQQRSMHGFGLVSNAFAGHYPQGSTNQSFNFGGASISYLAANDQNNHNFDKGRRRERDRDSISLFSDSNYIFNDRNRGPRASKVKGEGAAVEQGQSFHTGKNEASSTRIYFDLYNRPDFATDYEMAKFFIIKSFSEDNVHKSIKYRVWASTPHGNKKLDAAYHESKAMEGSCPIFLFFSLLKFFKDEITKGLVEADERREIPRLLLQKILYDRFTKIDGFPEKECICLAYCINVPFSRRAFESFGPILAMLVNASGQFCGVAEMVGPVDFEKSANYWQQDRWSGQFPVQWHIVKDVPNIRFRHIILENNDSKPVTHSRDSQEVKLKHGLEMLKIFKEHDTRTSILDDFDFYDEREKMLKERKSRQQPYPTKESPIIADDTINPLSNSFAQALQLDAQTKEEPVAEKRVTEQSATSRTDAQHSLEDHINQTPDRISQVIVSEQSMEGLVL